MSSPVCSDCNIALQDFNRHALTTSAQHKEVTETRMKRDQSDIAKLGEKLESCNLISADDPSLCNIITGIMADDNVDVDEFCAVGQKCFDKLVGIPVFTYSFKRKDKAKTLGDSTAVKVTPGKSIDPAVLFQRLIVICKTGDFSLEDILKCELSSFSPAYFETNYVFRKS